MVHTKLTIYFKLKPALSTTVICVQWHSTRVQTCCQRKQLVLVCCIYQSFSVKARKHSYENEKTLLKIQLGRISGFIQSKSGGGRLFLDFVTGKTCQIGKPWSSRRQIADKQVPIIFRLTKFLLQSRNLDLNNFYLQFNHWKSFDYTNRWAHESHRSHKENDQYLQRWNGKLSRQSPMRCRVISIFTSFSGVHDTSTSNIANHNAVTTNPGLSGRIESTDNLTDSITWPAVRFLFG